MILASQETVAAAITYPAHRLHLGDWANEVTFVVDIQSLSGAPSTASLTASIQAVMPHTTGNQYLNERVFALDATQLTNLTAEGEDWPNPVCTQASSFPVTVQRTYIGFGKDLRLTLTPSFTGGSSPAFVLSVLAHGKG